MKEYFRVEYSDGFNHLSSSEAQKLEFYTKIFYNNSGDKLKSERYWNGTLSSVTYYDEIKNIEDISNSHAEKYGDIKMMILSQYKETEDGHAYVCLSYNKGIFKKKNQLFYNKQGHCICDIGYLPESLDDVMVITEYDFDNNGNIIHIQEKNPDGSLISEQDLG